jgi:arginase
MALRGHGPAIVGQKMAQRFARDPGRFWLHLDLDVLDQQVMPAVDYRMPGGLDWPEAEALLQPMVASPALLGLDVTILNPTLDPAGEHTRRAVDFLAKILAA